MSKVISLDLEMNPVSGKIIQVGYVIGDIVTNTILLHRSILVNPNEPLQVIPELGVHISDYTGITEDMVCSAGSLQDAYLLMCEDIKRYNPTTTCVQWGDGMGDGKGDHDHLRQELKLTWKEFIFRARSWDVKSYFQIYRAFNRKSVAAGLVNATESLGLKFIGRPHDASYDALNTFYIFHHIGMKLVNFDKIQRMLL